MSHRTERHRFIIRFIEVIHPLKVDHRYEFLRDQDRIAFSSHTSSIPPLKLAGAASGEPRDHSHSIVFSVSFFNPFPTILQGERQVVTNSAVRRRADLLIMVTSPLFYSLLLCFGGFGVHLHNSTGSCVIGTDEQLIPQPTVSPVLLGGSSHLVSGL